ncbi:MAG TPA: YqaJ viral recombinase family protein [Coriobacteriia bacterium]
MSAVATAFVQGTPEWVDARRDVVGSSDIPIITGSSPYSTSLFALWAIKTRLAEPEPPDPQTQELFDLGHALEDPIAARYTVITGRPLRRHRRLLVHPRDRWMGASLDRVSARRGERRIVEVKWVPNRRWATDGPEPVPSYVQDQVQWQLAVTGWDVADVVVLNGSHVDVHEVAPSEHYQADLRYLARDFWDRVEAGEHPAVDGSEATRDAIVRIHPRDTLGLMPPTPEVAALAHELREATAARKAAIEEDGRLRNVMRLLLDEYAGVEDDDYRIHFRRSADRRSTTTDWESLARLWMPSDDLIAAHTATEIREGSRSLIPKFLGDDGRWS